MLGAEFPHATINSIDISRAKDYPGVFAIHVFDNMIEGANPKGE